MCSDEKPKVALASVPLQDKPLFRFGGTFISIGLLCTIVAAAYTLVLLFLVGPVQKQLDEANLKLSASDSAARAKDKEYQDLDAAYRALAKISSSPLLVSPADEAEVVAREIPFRWRYQTAGKFQTYLLEIVPLDSPASRKLLEVVRPEDEVYYFPNSLLANNRRIFWRVMPGKMVSGAPVITGTPSPYGYFTWDPSVIEHIRRTGRLVVGINPQLTGPFERQDASGQLEGLDVELVTWLTSRLAEKIKPLGESLTVEFNRLPWDELLPSLLRHDVDVVISSMTRTSEREQMYPGVRFTRGYFLTHQILIGTHNAQFQMPRDLNSKLTIGTISDTTNQKAAKLLAERHGFKVRDEFHTFDDLYSALDQQRIDLALVDDVFVYDKLSSQRYKQFLKLDEELRKTSFYKEVIGAEQEEYAIAVNDSVGQGPGTETLVEMLNSLLESPEGKAHLAQLRKGISAD